MLKTELGVVRSNLSTMSDMMSHLDPVTAKQADMELLEVKMDPSRGKRAPHCFVRSLLLLFQEKGFPTSLVD